MRKKNPIPRSERGYSHHSVTTRSFTVTFPVEELGYLEVLAKELGMPRSQALLTTWQCRRFADAEERRLLSEARQDLARVGANLNQIAHALNRGAPVRLEAIQAAAEAVATTVRLLKKRI
ncbi:MAG: plasmid mobilization relaxosome protein MobC [Acidithiobacillus sp.]